MYPEDLERAVCRNEDPELFFPQGEDKIYPSTQQTRVIEAAKAVCIACDIRIICLNEALEQGIEFGIWGGMTSAERRQLIRQRRLTG